MKVQDVMSKEPKTCRADDMLVAAARIHWEQDCGAVPVVDDHGRLTGIVTDRDACMAAYTRGRRLDEIPVRTAMAKILFTCRADEPVDAALAVMRQKQVRRLPVVDATGKLCGIVSVTDIVRAAGSSDSAPAVIATLAAIGAPRALGGQPVAPRPGAGKTDSRPVAGTAPAAVVMPKAPASPPPLPTSAPAPDPAGKAPGGKKR